MTIDNRSLSGLIRSVIQTHPKKSWARFPPANPTPSFAMRALDAPWMDLALAAPAFGE
jgi:hypothetical protein